MNDDGFTYQTITPSSVVFGGVDEDLFEQPLQSYPLVNNIWWSIDIKSVSYGTTQMFVSDESSTAFGIIDTGTSLMYVPVDILNQFVGLWVTKLGSKL